MHHKIDIAHRHIEAFAIAHIANKIAHAGMVETLLHFKLLELITGVDDQSCGLVAG